MSLTTQIVLQRFTSTQLEELQKEINSRTYHYIIAIEDMENACFNDLFCFKSIIIINIEDLPNRLYEDDKIMKYLYGSSFFRERTKADIFDRFSALKETKNEKEIAAYIRENINKNIIYECIAEHTNGDIKIFDNSFDRVRLIKKDDYEIVKMPRRTELYSY